MLVDLLGGRVLFGLDEREHQFVAALGERSPLTLSGLGCRSRFSSLTAARYCSEGVADQLQNLVNGGDGVLLAVGLLIFNPISFALRQFPDLAEHPIRPRVYGTELKQCCGLIGLFCRGKLYEE